MAKWDISLTLTLRIEAASLDEAQQQAQIGAERLSHNEDGLKAVVQSVVLVEETPHA